MKNLIMVLCLLFASTKAFASVCPEPKELNDVLECLRNKHKLVLLKNLEVENTEKLGEALGQIPNPTLNAQSVFSEDASETEVTLMQNVDIGGKLNALEGKGKLIHAMKKNELALTKEEVIQEVLLNIHHLTHLHETLKVNREILSSLNKVIKALTGRPALTPEQEASLLNFRLQEGEVRNQVALLEDEEEEVLLFFLVNGGYRKKQMLSVMEEHAHTLHIKEDEGLSLTLNQLALQTKLAEKELTLAKAQVFEDIKIGPRFLREGTDRSNENLFGIAVQIPLPLWNTNSAGKALARTTLLNAQKNFNLLKDQEDLKKNSLKKRIKKLSESLKLLPERDELIKTHARVEKLYTRGLITPSSFLDSHRIWRDVTSSRLELEEKILQLNIAYYRLIGKLNEVHL